MRLAADIPVFAGTFASQPLVFAHLLDAAQAQGLNPDLDNVEVIAHPFDRRLAAFFDPATIAAIDVGTANTLVVILPGAHFALTDTTHLRLVGRFAGHVTRAALPTEGFE